MRISSSLELFFFSSRDRSCRAMRRPPALVIERVVVVEA
jgi:hypothetical protein